jgi:signal transduction histidine kinase
MRAKNYALVLILAVLMSGANLYFGMPLHIGEAGNTAFTGPVDESLMPRITVLLDKSAQFLDGLGIPSRFLDEVPTYTFHEELGLWDALVNVWTSVSITLVGTVLGVLGSMKLMVTSILQFQILAALGGLFFIVMAPFLFLFVPAVILASLIFAESTTAYLAIVIPTTLLICIPAVIVFYRSMHFVWRKVIVVASAAAVAWRARRRTARSVSRVEEFGIEYEKQLQDAEREVPQAEEEWVQEEAPAAPVADDEKTAAAGEWDGVLDEEDLESLFAEGDTISKHEKAQDVSAADEEQLFSDEDEDRHSIEAAAAMLRLAALGHADSADRDAENTEGPEVPEVPEASEAGPADDDTDRISINAAAAALRQANLDLSGDDYPVADHSEDSDTDQLRESPAAAGIADQEPEREATAEVEQVEPDSEPAAPVERSEAEVEPAAVGQAEPDRDEDEKGHGADQEEAPAPPKPLPTRRFRGTLTRHDRKRS